MKLAVINFSMIYFVAVPIFSKTQVNIAGGTFDTALVPVLLSGKFFLFTHFCANKAIPFEWNTFW